MNWLQRSALCSLIVATFACDTGGGKERVLECEAQVAALQAEVERLKAELEQASKQAAPASPEWVNKGAHRDAEFAYAVGLVSGVRNPALARSAADNRARAELAKSLSLTQMSGVQIVDHWVSPEGDVYSLAKVALTAAEP